MNQAFRTEDVSLWYLFRFHVIDLSAQLKLVHQKQNIRTPFAVYRGQPRVPTSELKIFQTRIGCPVSMNGFFSSSMSIDIAKQFIAGAVETDDFKVVIFQTRVDESCLRSAVFVDIDACTGLTSEQGVLFNIASIFHAEDAYYDHQMNGWNISMRATDEFAHVVREKIDRMKQACGDGSTELNPIVK